MRRFLAMGALAVALLPMPHAGALPQGHCPRNAQGDFPSQHPADRNADQVVCLVLSPSGELVTVIDNYAFAHGLPPKMRH